MKATLEKLRGLDDHQKKVITFSVVGVLAVVGGAWWLNNFVKQVPQITQGLAESIQLPEISETTSPSNQAIIP